MMSSPPLPARNTSQRLSQRAIACAHCGESIGTCYGERVLAVGGVHLMRLTVMHCAKCGVQIRWAPAQQAELVEA